MRKIFLIYIENKFVYGPVAQLAEQFPFKEWVTGSNPVGLTINIYYIMNKLIILDHDYIIPS